MLRYFLNKNTKLLLFSVAEDDSTTVLSDDESTTASDMESTTTSADDTTTIGADTTTTEAPIEFPTTTDPDSELLPDDLGKTKLLRTNFIKLNYYNEYDSKYQLYYS